MSGAAGEQRRVRVQNHLGLHARPAAEFVKLAARFPADIRLGKGDLEVNGKSIMGVLMLAAECGTELVISASGLEAAVAANALADLVDRGFGEE